MKIKKLLCVLVAFVIASSCALSVSAENGKVTYDGKAKDFVFEPGSDYSLTDLFPNFKDVMPGDTIKQQITVKNDASEKVKIRLYIRSLGAQEGSEEFLSQLKLKVDHSEDNTMAYMFDAAANETAGLTDWVLLGTLFSGGEVNLDVTLEVPTSLTNEYKNMIGYLDWQFMIEELPIDPDDPEPPPTGDSTTIILIAAPILLVVIILILILGKKKDDEKEKGKEARHKRIPK